MKKIKDEDLFFGLTRPSKDLHNRRRVNFEAPASGRIREIRIKCTRPVLHILLGHQIVATLPPSGEWLRLRRKLGWGVQIGVELEEPLDSDQLATVGVRVELIVGVPG
jgi:hypothetical protein